MATTYIPTATAKLTVADNGTETMLPIARTDGKKGKSGNAIVVPALTSNQMDLIVLSPAGKEWLIDCVDSLRAKVASEGFKKSGIVSELSLGLDNLLKRMTEENNAGRLTMESIGAWFDSDMADVVSARLKEVVVGISDDKVAQLLAGYREAFQSVAGRSKVSDTIKAKLLKALELKGDDYDSRMASKIVEALTVEEKAKADILINL